MNTVNKNNFNVTMKGYLKRALKYADLEEEQQKKVWNGLRRAIDEMTMEDARKEYERY